MANMVRYRVWPDGTVQETAETPYSWMSDDYETVEAEDEEEACSKARGNLNEANSNPPLPD